MKLVMTTAAFIIVSATTASAETNMERQDRCSAAARDAATISASMRAISDEFTHNRDARDAGSITDPEFKRNVASLSAQRQSRQRLLADAEARTVGCP